MKSKLLSTGDYVKREYNIVLSGMNFAKFEWDAVNDWQLHYHLLDHLGSRQVVCNANDVQQGEARSDVRYGSFGEYEDGIESEYSFTGKQRDSATELSYFNARYYDAEVGRFITMDPIRDGINWYVYCANNPLKYVDPTGLEIELGKLLGRLVGTATSTLEAVVTCNPIAAADAVAGLVSTVVYVASDGNAELSTSALGLTAQIITYAATGDADAAAVAGAAGDIVSAGASVTRGLMTLGTATTKGVALTLNAVVNMGGDMYLGAETCDDTYIPSLLSEAETETETATNIVTTFDTENSLDYYN